MRGFKEPEKVLQMSSESMTENPSLGLNKESIKQERSDLSNEISGNIAIKIDQLSKCYQVYDSPRDRLKQFIFPKVRKIIGQSPKHYFQEFWALKNISFGVNRGETVGILGRNGAGKSTLLQIICGTLIPTSGRVEVNGSIAALLELGSGFNPEFSGRENVYLNAAVLGLGKEQVDERFDDIAAFADIGDFLDQPVKTYSTGMLMRLAFAVNTSVDPDILIIDEALSVGDAPFQAKCFKRLKKLIASGKSILFVSHDISTVRSTCDRALWLKEGEAKMWGHAKRVTKEYEKYCWEEQGVIAKEGNEKNNAIPPKKELPVNEASAQDFWKETINALGQTNMLLPLNDSSAQLGNMSLIIQALSITNSLGERVKEINYAENITVHYKLLAQKNIDSEFMIGIRIRNLCGDFICSINDVQNIQRIQLNAGKITYARMSFNLPLSAGDYILRTGIFGFKDGIAIPPEGYDFSRAILWDIREDAMFIKVLPYKVMALAGPVNIKAHLELFETPINNLMGFPSGDY